MTANEANKIDINNEKNIDKLRELVKYWQDIALNAVAELQKHKPTFTLKNIQISKEETNNQK
jgi:hypothetical protein